MNFEVEFDNQPEKFLKKAERLLVKRLLKEIEELRKNPFPQGVKRVLGRKERTFRVRVGDYRILYVVFFEDNCLFISKIEKRPKAY